MRHPTNRREISSGWVECIHRPTVQRHIRLDEPCNVETIHGTMCGRKGDHLMQGTDGELPKQLR